jgi:transcriptional regulator GlxA family with amidase domain
MNKKLLSTGTAVLALFGLIAVPAAADPVVDKPLPPHPLVVEIVATPGATLLDFAGPAEVFGVLTGHAREYIVSDRTKPFKLENGVVVSPDYTFANAPKPDIVIIGSQQGKGSEEAMTWLRRIHDQGGTIMSVCTGADWLAQSHLLDGLKATTNHNAIQSYGAKYTAVKFVSGKRYVQSESRLFTAGGYTAGLDLALHLVDARFGRETASGLARRLEYPGTGWMTNSW